VTKTFQRSSPFRAVLLALALSLVGGAASAQPADDLKVSIYPVFAWIPTGLDIDVEVPPFDGGSGGRGEIVDGRFDGAYLGGLSLAKGLWRIDADGMWAAVGGDRVDTPVLRVDVDAIYFHASGGVKVAPDFYVTGGVRRLALKYDIQFGDQPSFERKPGVWDPLVGVGYHRQGERFEIHGTFEGGGFGVGADVDLAGTIRFDWKPVTHFGLTAGYSVLYFKVEDEVLSRTFTVKQTMHGPIVGIGLYF
jgi:hypothetical protein